MGCVEPPAVVLAFGRERGRGPVAFVPDGEAEAVPLGPAMAVGEGIRVRS